MRQLLKDIHSQYVSRKGSAGSFWKASSVSAINQGVSSGTNFFLSLVLVRVLTPAEFGLYGIGIAASIFACGFGDSLFLTQMVVHSPDKKPENRPIYAASILTAVSLFCLIVILALIPGLLLADCFSLLSVFQVHFAFAVAAAFASFVLKDFFVRHAYNIRQETIALQVNLVVAVSMAFLLSVLFFWKPGFNVLNSLWIYSGSNGVGALFGYWRSKLPLRKVRWPLLKSDFQEAWEGGRWASIASLAYQFRAYAYMIATGILIGPVGVGMLNASRMLIQPVAQMTQALSMVFIPRLASERQQDPGKMLRTGVLCSLGLLVLALIYSLVLLLAYDHLVPLVLGGKYSNLKTVTIFWCFYICVSSFRLGLEVTCLAFKKFSRLMQAGFVGAVATITATYLMCRGFGLWGAVMGLSIGECALIPILWSVLAFGMKTLGHRTEPARSMSAVEG